MKKIKYIVCMVLIFVLCACEGLIGYRIPCDLEGYKGQDALSVLEEFQEAGVTDVQTKVVYDLPLEKIGQVGQITSLTINDAKDYKEDDYIPLESKVEITYHDLMKHNVKIHINFEGNWFFDKYDVKFIADKEHSDVLKHGENVDLEYELKEGEYTFKFVDAEDKKVTGQTKLVVRSDVEASYTIHCYTDQVAVKEDYVNQENTMEEDQVKMTCDVRSFINVDYKEVVSLFENSGFTNITTEPVYDIRYGITLEESCADVTIDGQDMFKAGDIYQKDVPVVIYYHMKEEQAQEPALEEDSEREYTLAFKRSYGDFDVYYLFDEESNVVCTFKTDESGISMGRFVGSFEDGVEMIFSDEENMWKEIFQVKDKKATLTDARKYSYAYESVTVKDGKAAMEKVLEK